MCTWLYYCWHLKNFYFYCAHKNVKEMMFLSFFSSLYMFNINKHFHFVCSASFAGLISKKRREVKLMSRMQVKHFYSFEQLGGTLPLFDQSTLKCKMWSHCHNLLRISSFWASPFCCLANAPAAPWRQFKTGPQRSARDKSNGMSSIMGLTVIWSDFCMTTWHLINAF